MQPVSLINVNALLPDEGIVETSLRIEDGRITSLGNDVPHSDVEIDCGGLLALPGIVDIHGDAFERQIMPRANVSFRLDVALHDTDRQMVANGITTAYHGVTYSWEPGLRGRDNCVAMLEEVEALQPFFGCDTRIHLRYETFNVDAVDDITAWMGAGLIGIFAFNDHTPKIVQLIEEGSPKIKRDLDRSGLSLSEYSSLASSVHARAAEVPAAIETLAAVARENRLPILSHDDTSPEMRRYYHALGCETAEFPMNEETAVAAMELGNNIVLGAPNVMRGGSHNGAVNAADMIEKKLCNILASDYYYPAPLNAAFKLVDDGVVDFEHAWNLISLNPARAAGLGDRGEIGVGMRADILLVDAKQTDFPRIIATMTEGKFVYQAATLSDKIVSVPFHSQVLSA